MQATSKHMCLIINGFFRLISLIMKLFLMAYSKISTYIKRCLLFYLNFILFTKSHINKPFSAYAAFNFKIENDC